MRACAFAIRFLPPNQELLPLTATRASVLVATAAECFDRSVAAEIASEPTNTAIKSVKRAFSEVR